MIDDENVRSSETVPFRNMIRRVRELTSKESAPITFVELIEGSIINPKRRLLEVDIVLGSEDAAKKQADTLAMLYPNVEIYSSSAKGKRVYVLTEDDAARFAALEDKMWQKERAYPPRDTSTQ